MIPTAADDVQAFDGVAAARAGDVLFVLWKLPPTAERFDWLEARLDELVAEQASFVVCQLILPSSTPPNARLRARGRESLARLRGKLRRLISVPLGDAVWISVVRIVMRGMSIVSGHAETSTIASSAREALDQVAAAATHRTPERERLVEAVERGCATLRIDRRDVGL